MNNGKKWAPSVRYENPPGLRGGGEGGEKEY